MNTTSLRNSTGVIEALEQRIAPAAVFTFTDLDGDQVTVRTSKGTNQDLAAVLTLADAGDGKQLQVIDLSANPIFAGTDLLVTAKKSATGDGRVNVGYVDATQVNGGGSLDLGTVKIKGDLGQIDAGDPETNTMAIKSLGVQSMGRLGLVTQGGTGDLTSEIYGPVGALKVANDVRGAWVKVHGDFMAAQGKLANGRIGSVQIGGSLIGTSSDSSGLISTTGAVGTVFIGGDVRGSEGSSSGRIAAQEITGSVTVIGSVIGSAGGSSGAIYADAQIASIKVGGDLLGGSGSNSGNLRATGIERVHVGGSVVGGDGVTSGAVLSNDGTSTISIGGDLIGGVGNSSGRVTAANVKSLTINGSVVGEVEYSGYVDIFKTAGVVKVGGDLIGKAERSGYLDLNSIDTLSIGGSLMGGGVESGSVLLSGNKAVTSVVIGGNLVGGAERSGSLQSSVEVANLTVGGSVIGGSGFSSGSINLFGESQRITIKGDLVGGSVTGTDSASFSGSISVGRVDALTIGGSVYAGTNTGSGTLNYSGSILVRDDLGSLKVKGSIVGNATNEVLIVANGQKGLLLGGGATDLAIGKLNVGKNVEFARVLAGYGFSASSPTGLNGDASIGTVRVGGDWIASDLVAGIKQGNADGFGTASDTVIPGSAEGLIASIAKVQIAGQVLGSPAKNDSYGFVAEQIGSFSAGGRSLALTSGKNEPVSLASTTNDVIVREV
jgi:hypothetical protein